MCTEWETVCSIFDIFNSIILGEICMENGIFPTKLHLFYLKPNLSCLIMAPKGWYKNIPNVPKTALYGSSVG